MYSPFVLLNLEITFLVRSKCPKCDSQIHWYDNLPVISFLLLKGKCRQCKEPISIQYPVVELVMGILAVVFYEHNSSFLPYILLMGMGYHVTSHYPY